MAKEEEYKIVLGRSSKKYRSHGTEATVLLGRQLIKMIGSVEQGPPVYLDLDKAHVLFVCGKRGCLTGDTLIYTKKGFKPIKDYDEKKDFVYSFNRLTKQFEWEKAQLLSYPIRNEKLIRVKCSHGQELTLTAEHPLLVYHRKELIWKIAEELKETDHLVTTTSVPVVRVVNKSSLRIARLLGFVLADGSIHIRKVRRKDGRGYWYTGIEHRVRIFNCDLEVINQAKADLHKEFDVKVGHYPRNDCNCDVVESRHSKVVKKLVSLGVPEGNKSGIIQVPAIVWESNNRFKANFLKALFSCDGYVRPGGGRIEYCSKSKKFIEQLQVLLSHFNIESSIRLKTVKQNDKIFKNYDLFISDYSSVINYRKEIGFYQKEKELRLSKRKFWRVKRRKRGIYVGDKLFCPKIKEISRVDNIKKVYDLRVSKNHSFIANGIISHNSGKSYSMGAIVEGIAMSDKKEKISVILLDTMGIYWTMKYPNHKPDEAKLLKNWRGALKNHPELEGRGFTEVKVYTPYKYHWKYVEQDKELGKETSRTDEPFSLLPRELGPEDWWLALDLDPTSRVAVFVESVILKLRDKYESGRIDNYGIKDIIAEIKKADEAEDIKKQAVTRFQAADGWGLFSDEATEIEDLAKGGQVTVIDLSCYAQEANGWKIKSLALGIVSKKLFMERMAARKNEEFAAIDSTLHYILEEDKKSTGGEMPIVWIFIDEAHEFLPLEGRTGSSDALITLLREGRQPGIAMVMATQQPGRRGRFCNALSNPRLK
ncbi:LAGLIDADG family homing endonuclease [Nanoarchaeota archaeon]